MKTKNKLIHILLTVAITLTAMILVFFDDVDDVWLIIKRINMIYFSIIIVLAFVYHFMVAIVLTKLTKSIDPNYTYFKGFINALIAAFFHGVTPGASGGQVAQLYVFKKQGIQATQASSILLLDFLVYQTALLLVSFGFLLMKFQHYLLRRSFWFVFVVIGFTLNLLILVGLFLLANNQSFYYWITTKGIEIAVKLRVVRDPIKTLAFVQQQATRFYQQQSNVLKKWKLMVELLFVNIIRVSLFTIIPYFILLSLGIKISSLTMLDIMALMSFISMMQIFVPFPGGFGGVEALFIFLFSSITSITRATSTMLIWRFATFYLMMLVGGLVFVGFKIAYRR